MTAVELTREADYAIRCVLEAARHNRISTAELAQHTELSPSFLGKIVGVLARAGILETRRGAGGGVRLGRPADAITVLEVIEAVQGPLHVNRCMRVPPACERAQHCPILPLCREAQEALVATFSVTFDHLLAEEGADPASAVAR